MEALQPPGWPRPRGYANGVAAPAGGTLVFVAGQIGWDEIAYIGDDELVEVTPKAIRLRKKLLDRNDRKREERRKEPQGVA